MMSKGLSSDSQVHISIAFLIKAMIGISMMIAAYYYIQMRFASLDRSLGDIHDEVVVLQQKVAAIEEQHLEELEHRSDELEQENKTLMQRLGLKRK